MLRSRAQEMDWQDSNFILAILEEDPTLVDQNATLRRHHSYYNMLKRSWKEYEQNSRK